MKLFVFIVVVIFHLFAVICVPTDQPPAERRKITLNELPKDILRLIRDNLESNRDARMFEIMFRLEPDTFPTRERNDKLQDAEVQDFLQDLTISSEDDRALVRKFIALQGVFNPRTRSFIYVHTLELNGEAPEFYEGLRWSKLQTLIVDALDNGDPPAVYPWSSLTSLKKLVLGAYSDFSLDNFKLLPVLRCLEIYGPSDDKLGLLSDDDASAIVQHACETGVAKLKVENFVLTPAAAMACAARNTNLVSLRTQVDGRFVQQFLGHLSPHNNLQTLVISSLGDSAVRGVSLGRTMLPQLKTFRLGYSGDTNIEVSETLSEEMRLLLLRMPALETLEFREGDSEVSFPAEVVGNMKHLKSLTISNVAYKDLEIFLEALPENNSLRELSLTDLKLGDHDQECIPAQLEKLKHLTTFFLAGESYECRWLDYMPKVQRVELVGLPSIEDLFETRSENLKTVKFYLTTSCILDVLLHHVMTIVKCARKIKSIELRFSADSQDSLDFIAQMAEEFRTFKRIDTANQMEFLYVWTFPRN